MKHTSNVYKMSEHLILNIQKQDINKFKTSIYKDQKVTNRRTKSFEINLFLYEQEI